MFSTVLTAFLHSSGFNFSISTSFQHYIRTLVPHLGPEFDTCVQDCKGLLWWLNSKDSTCQCRRLGSIPGLGRSPEGRHGNPLQYSCLENSMERGAWWAKVHGVTKKVGHDLATKQHLILTVHRHSVVLKDTLLIFLCLISCTTAKVEDSFTPVICNLPLGWQKSSFRFFYKMLQKDTNTNFLVNSV